MKNFFLQLRALVRLSFLELWRRNDVFGLLILALALMVPLSLARPFGTVGASRYLDEVALLLIWGFSLFIALGTGARLLPPEFESRTILPLLAKPISRGRLLAGKYLGAVAASCSALLVFYALFALSSVVRGGDGLSAALAQAVLLHMAFVAVAVALSLLGSLLVTPSANLTLNALALVAMFLFGCRLPEYASAAGGAVGWLARVAYVVAPHAEFFDLRQRVIHGWGAVDASVVCVVLLYAALYVAAVLGLAALSFGRRRP